MELVKPKSMGMRVMKQHWPECVDSLMRMTESFLHYVKSAKSANISIITGLTNLLGHDPTTEPGIALRQWVHHQGVENHLDLLSWEEDEVKANPTQQVFSLDDHGQGSYLRTNQTKQICGLITYMKHVFSQYMSEGVRTNL